MQVAQFLLWEQYRMGSGPHDQSDLDQISPWCILILSILGSSCNVCQSKFPISKRDSLRNALRFKEKMEVEFLAQYLAPGENKCHLRLLLLSWEKD